MGTPAQYTAAAARADKLLQPDGSIKTQSGTVVSGPSAAGAAQYSAAAARADKLLEPDGSIVTSGSGSGGSTPPGGATGQVQYNNGGVFGGAASVTTNGTNLSVLGATGNGLVVNPTAAGTAPNITASGTDTNVGAIIQTKGTGAFQAIDGSGNYIQGSAGSLTLHNGPSNWTATMNVVGNNQFQLASNGNLQLGNINLNSIISNGLANISIYAANNYIVKLATQYSSISSGVAYFCDICPQSAVSGAAGYTATRISVYENSTATGPKLLLDAGLNSAAAGAGTHTSKFNISDIGAVFHALAGIPVYANNTAATGGGLVAGNVYRTGSDPDQLCIVH